MRDEYEERGFVVVRGLFAPEAIRRAQADADALLRRTDLISERNLRCRYMANVVTGESQFETFDPVADVSPACRAIADDAGLMALLAGLYGEPARLFKDKLIYKPPGCRGYELHQDWPPWPGFPTSFLTVLIPLDATTLANGCTIVYPGYHKQGSFALSTGQYYPMPGGIVDEARAVPLELEPGDAAVFGGYVPHRSAPNQSGGWRRQLFLSYNKDSDGGEQRAAHYEQFHQRTRARLAEQGKTDLYFE